jgi:hypothetical protein
VEERADSTKLQNHNSYLNIPNLNGHTKELIAGDRNVQRWSVGSALLECVLYCTSLSKYGGESSVYNVSFFPASILLEPLVTIGSTLMGYINSAPNSKSVY